MARFIFILCFISFVSPSFAFASQINRFEIKYLSYVYHAYDPDYDGTEHFGNQFFSIGYDLTPRHNFLVGTFKNSQDNRCFATGLDYVWANFNNGWRFKGSYLYAGEFFFDDFSSCGDEGYILKSKKSPGLVCSLYKSLF